MLSLDAGGEVVAEQTAADLARASRQAARALLELGVGKGDHVFVMLPRDAGVVRGDARRDADRRGPDARRRTCSRRKDIAYRIGRTGAAVAAITDEAGAAKVDATRRPASAHPPVRRASTGRLAVDFDARCDAAGDGETPDDPTGHDDPLLLYFTSGTVAYPKMVQHPQSYALGHVGDRALLARPAPGRPALDGHRHRLGEGGLGRAVRPVARARVRSSRSRSASPTPTRSSAILARHRDHVVLRAADALPPARPGGSPAHDLSALRHCTSAGEPLNPEVIRAWEDGTGGLTVYDGYGQTETTCLVANYRCDAGAARARWASRCRAATSTSSTTTASRCRRRRSATSWCACDRACPVGLFAGYYGDPAADGRRRSAAAVLLHRRQGRRGRGRLLLVRGPRRRRHHLVAPTGSARSRSSRALVEHPAVMEAAVVGKDDPRAHPDRHRVLHPRRRATSGRRARAASSRTSSSELTAPYKYPREIHFVDELPKTVSGKIRRSRAARAAPVRIASPTQPLRVLLWPTCAPCLVAGQALMGPR